MVDSDAIAETVTETGQVYAGPIRVKKFVVTSDAGGSVVLRDGGATGDVKVTQAISSGTIDITVPVGGFRFRKDVHATLTGVASATFYMA